MSRRIAVPTLTLLLVACGGDERSAEAGPSPSHRTVAAAPAAIRIAVTPDLSTGTCEQVSGDVWNRPAFRAAALTIEPNRRIIVLVDSSGILALYRDQVMGRGGYTIQLDVAADSAFAFDRATAQMARGPVADFRDRADLGPPSALAAQVLGRCGDSPAR